MNYADVDNILKIMIFLAHLAFMLMSICNQELSGMWHPTLSSLSLLLASSVDSPSHRFDHRNFIFCTCNHICT